VDKVEKNRNSQLNTGQFSAAEFTPQPTFVMTFLADRCLSLGEPLGALIDWPV
jgi:hypothetical protein